jgi:hypothetical protein
LGDAEQLRPLKQVSKLHRSAIEKAKGNHQRRRIFLS